MKTTFTSSLHGLTGQGPEWQAFPQRCLHKALGFGHGWLQDFPFLEQGSLWHGWMHLCVLHGNGLLHGKPHENSLMWHGIVFRVCNRIKWMAICKPVPYWHFVKKSEINPKSTTLAVLRPVCRLSNRADTKINIWFEFWAKNWFRRFILLQSDFIARKDLKKAIGPGL